MSSNNEIVEKKIKSEEEEKCENALLREEPKQPINHLNVRVASAVVIIFQNVFIFL